MYTTVAPSVHFNEESFRNAPRTRENMLVHAKGFINIEKDDNFVFRLVSDDGSRMWLDHKLLIDNDGFHSAAGKRSRDRTEERKTSDRDYLLPGRRRPRALLQWATHDKGTFSVIGEEKLRHTKSDFKKSFPYVPLTKLIRSVPGDQHDEAGVHPSFKLEQARPSSFQPKVGGWIFFLTVA